MRFCKYWAIGAIVITLLSACSDFRQGNSPSSTSKDFTLHAVSGSEHLTNRNIELITSVYGISSQASTETGLYEIVPSGTKGSNIIYTDFDSKKYIKSSNSLQPSKSSYSLGIPPTRSSTSSSPAVTVTAENNKAIFTFLPFLHSNLFLFTFAASCNSPPSFL